MKEEWLLRGAAVPVTCETVTELIAEIKRLIDVVGGMALAKPDHFVDTNKMVAQQDHFPDARNMVAERLLWLEALLERQTALLERQTAMRLDKNSSACLVDN